MLRVLIVDDEPLARENLRVLLQEQSDIEVVGECANAIEGIGAVHKLRPDVLFLDIQMPRISGLEMVGMLDPEHRPYIVFLTAFDEYAVKAFEEHAFDYLLKPIEEKRLEKTLTRLRRGAYRAGRDAAAGASAAPEVYPLYRAQPDLPSANGRRCFCQQPSERGIRHQRRRQRRLYRADPAHAGEPHAADPLPSSVSGEHGAPEGDPHRKITAEAELVLRAGQTVPVSRRYLKSLKEAIGL